MIKISQYGIIINTNSKNWFPNVLIFVYTNDHNISRSTTSSQKICLSYSFTSTIGQGFELESIYTSTLEFMLSSE